jgi:hypothetical protein
MSIYKVDIGFYVTADDEDVAIDHVLSGMWEAGIVEVNSIESYLETDDEDDV